MRTRTFPVCRRYPIQLYMTGNITPASMQSATSENGIAPFCSVRQNGNQAECRQKQKCRGRPDDLRQLDVHHAHERARDGKYVDNGARTCFTSRVDELICGDAGYEAYEDGRRDRGQRQQNDQQRRNADGGHK